MTLHVDRAGGVVTLRLDNPGKRNALDIELATALRQAAASLRDDRKARCVVVTGTGDSFCSGANLGAMREIATGHTLARRDLLLEYYRAFLDIRDLPMPTLAAVNGPAVGAGLNLALCCDMRIAAESARFGAPFVRLGINPGGGASYLLARLLGPARAAEVLLVGEVLDSARALEIGLVNRVVPDAELPELAAEVAQAIAVGAPRVVRMTKRTLRLAEDAEFAAVLDIESLAQAASYETDEAGEGWTAFRERRLPNFADR